MRRVLVIILAAILPGLLVTACSNSNPVTGPTAQAANRLLIDLAGQKKELLTDSQGRTTSDIEASSAGAEIKIGLTRGAQALDRSGAPLQTIQAVIEPQPPAPATDTYFIGRAYTLKPAGAVFKPWLELTLGYKSQDLPPGINVADLNIAYNDGTTWRFTDYRRVDAYSVTIHADHLATFAIMAQKTTTPAVTSPPVGNRRGNTAPDFNLPTLDGKTVSLTGLRGKPVVINFWTTWCTYCVEEMPLLEQLYRKWSAQGLVFLAIDSGEDAATVKAFVQKQGLSFPVLLDDKSEVTEKYNIAGLPTTYFIDTNGIIRELKIGAFANLVEIENLLKKIMP